MRCFSENHSLLVVNYWFLVPNDFELNIIKLAHTLEHGADLKSRILLVGVIPLVRIDKNYFLEIIKIMKYLTRTGINHTHISGFDCPSMLIFLSLTIGRTEKCYFFFRQFFFID